MSKSKNKHKAMDFRTAPQDTRGVTDTWSARDQKIADAQGWGIFETSCRGSEIERVDEFDVFETDAEAEDYVIRQAARGDKTAQKALKLVGAIKIYHLTVSLAINLPYPIPSKDWNKALWQAIQERVAAGVPDDVEELVTISDVTVAEKL